MPLRPPPDDLASFPERREQFDSQELYRIFWHRDPGTGAVNSPWHFGSVPPGRNRFDLPAPAGTCYWSDRRYGAFVEVFRGLALIDEADLRVRRLWTGTAPRLRLADLCSKAAYAQGVTAAISTQPNYALPQAWARALHGLGFEGVVGTCSHDPSSTALNIGVFGKAGTAKSRSGWTTKSSSIERDTQLLGELAGFGIRISPVPFDVQVIAPPP